MRTQILGKTINTAMIFLLALACYAMSGFAAKKTGDLLSFKRWKSQQVVEAKNGVVRLSNRIHLLKTGRYKLEPKDLKGKGAPLLGDQGEEEYENLKGFDVKSVDEETLKAAEKKVLKNAEARMQVALGSLQYAKELSIDDYLAVYLSRFQADEKSLKRVVRKLSDADILALVKSQINKSPSNTSESAAKSSSTALPQDR